MYMGIEADSTCLVRKLSHRTGSGFEGYRDGVVGVWTGARIEGVLGAAEGGASC